tara:strand:- start:853 stop:2352 length:1500 start_codon:yes stop_codon:yes gene_type:complete
MAYKFQLGASTMSGSLTQEGAVTVKNLVDVVHSINEIDGAVSGSGTLYHAGAASFSSAVASSGSITAGTSFIIGSADLNETDMEKLDGITNGTVAANKAVVVDASSDADGFRNIDGTGDLTMGTITMSGFTVDADGDTALKSLAVDDASNIGCDSDTDLLALNSNLFTVNGTQLMKGALSGSSTLYAAGAASFSSTIAASGSISSAGASISGTSALAVVTATSYSGSSTLEAVGAAKFGSSLEVSGTVKLAGVTETAIAVADDSLYFKDSDGLMKSESVADLMAFAAGDGLVAASGVLAANVDDSSIEINSDALRVKAAGIVDAMLNDDVATGLAGVGLSAASGVMALDLNELSAADINVANDSIAIIDADDSNGSKKESIADLVTAMAGAGLTATNGVLSTDAGVSTAVGDANATLAEGMNFGSATFTATRTWTLPASPSNGDIVRVKAPGALGGNDLIIAVDGGGSHLIDGQANIRLESDGGAVACMYVGSNVWIIF